MTNRPRTGVWKWVGLGLGIALVSCGLVAYQAWTVISQMWNDVKPQPPHITLQGRAVDGRLEFHLTYDPAALGVTALTVLDDADNPLWRVAGGGVGKVPVIVYGQVPTEPGVTWRQQIPEAGSPPPLPRGKAVKVVLEWKFSGGAWVGTQRSETGVAVPD